MLRPLLYVSYPQLDFLLAEISRTTTIPSSPPPSFMEELQRRLSILDGSPGRRFTIGVRVSLISEQRMEDYVLRSLRDRYSKRL